MTRTFARWARSERVTDHELLRGMAEIEAGLVDAQLGGGLVKKRLPRSGEGKRGGYRVIIALRSKQRAVFLFGFGKSDRANISKTELDALKVLANALLTYDDRQIEHAIEAGAISEIKSNG